ncbi:Rieske 2Fe-2S domain-containing protein [Pseudonocardia sp. DSM 110487]|uniref:aromatic ring-hydroxylating oxygenase subunit alpha n=1 Tax=Pseudonocardia sp. DSM 110487 TaxID=2865833 RepID=UPI001C6972FA|nr:Rieske 2Fe-2S domain-containing protein [Pseudonocardia sp. DSM 110487]QYN33513.1 Rieske 2Fe-2S domain-containing protein [Pseudonocardia sp. DSM 110487]
MTELDIDPLLHRVEQALAEDRLPAEIFNDDALFAAEMDQVFGTCWVFVAHESEIPNPGDFVQRRIGVDPVIVTRDGHGGVNVLSNYCRHRGTQVCQTDTGNSRFFKCPYHGWTYSNNGDLVGTPNMRGAYGTPLDAKEWGLFRAPRVDVRSGMIFASLAAEGPSLEEYLGDAAWMLEMLVDLHPKGMRVAGPPERYKLKSDWKTGAENFSGDAYHVGTLHYSNEQIRIIQGTKANVEVTRLYDFGSGHYSINMPFTEVAGPEFTFWGYGAETAAKFDLSGLDEAQQHIVTHEPPIIGNIFPNLSFVRAPIPLATDGQFTMQMAVATIFRQWQPIGPGQMEVWNWQFVWDFQSEEESLASAVAGQFVFGSAGTFEVDDTVAWEGAPKAAKSPWMKREDMQFNFEQAHRSVEREPDPAYQGRGIKRGTGYGEHNQLNFYRHWLRTLRFGAQPNTAGTFAS